MIGLYDYTVWLTYLSALSAGAGIVLTLTGFCHPYVGILFLMICGLCDAFDGRVARRKKNRTDTEKKYGIQIDSLSDLIAFGVLPVCIGHAMAGTSPNYHVVWDKPFPHSVNTITIFFMAVMLWYVLAALIRLAYYNVAEEERQNSDNGARIVYTGLPVTSAAIVFPIIALLQYILIQDITLVYFVVMLLMSIAFVTKISVPKPGLKLILVLCGIGLIEFVFLIVNLISAP